MTFFLGIDPGLCNTGWCIVEDLGSSVAYIDSGLIRTKRTKPIHNIIDKRLLVIFNGIQDICIKYQIANCAIENTYVNSNFNSSLKLAQARGTAVVACQAMGCNVIEYQAKTIKKRITGCGNADKKQVAHSLESYIAIDLEKLHHDETDAIAIAICHAIDDNNQMKKNIS